MASKKVVKKEKPTNKKPLVKSNKKEVITKKPVLNKTKKSAKPKVNKRTLLIDNMIEGISGVKDEINNPTNINVADIPETEVKEAKPIEVLDSTPIGENESASSNENDGEILGSQEVEPNSGRVGLNGNIDDIDNSDEPKEENEGEVNLSDLVEEKEGVEEENSSKTTNEDKEEIVRKPLNKKDINVYNKSKEQINDEVAEEAFKVIEERIKDNHKVNNGRPKFKHKVMLLISSLITMVTAIVFMFIDYTNEIKALLFLQDTTTINGVLSFVIFVILLVVTIINVYVLIDACLNFKGNYFHKKIKPIFNLTYTISIFYGVGGLAFYFVGLIKGQNIFSFAFIFPLVLTLILIFNVLVKSFYKRDFIFVNNVTDDNQYTYSPDYLENPEPLFVDSNDEERTAQVRAEPIRSFVRPFPSSFLLVCVLLFAGLMVGVLFLDMFEFIIPGDTYNIPKIKGIDFILRLGQSELTSNLPAKIMGFSFYIFLGLEGLFVLLSLGTFLGKRKKFYSFANTSIVLAFIFIMLVSLFGLFFKVTQGVNSTIIISTIGEFLTQEVIDNIENCQINTQTYFIGAAAGALLVILFAVNPMRNQLIYDELDDKLMMEHRLNAKEVTPETLGEIIDSFNLVDNKPTNDKGNAGSEGTGEITNSNDNPFDVSVVSPLEIAEKEEVETNEVILPTFDACPVLTEIDSKEEKYLHALQVRKSFDFKSPTLPSLVRFVVDYAKNSRLHLSYSFEDIATFVAGLGCARLTILQGMSGTGKTSLPKIFMEAIYGNCELIEIESSWREKNELLGFYNEFSKIYTPKKFTQCLYKAALNPEVVTFIVLDEMNLSRIEYYFSDFLSLMENEEDKRYIKLSNVKLFNTYDNKLHSYKKLVEDHTLKVPNNVFFIGTANRDESTFEISDKVYDRAHTMNFNKRAPSITKYDAEMKPQFLDYKTLADLFAKAKKSYKFDIDKNTTIKEVEKLLAPFNISFGNRIYRQIIDFVSVYCSCFENPKSVEFDAVERILLTKVVMKLENKNIDNREALINEFSKLKLTRCVEFISKLSEDY